jgi:hypothetical protein
MNSNLMRMKMIRYYLTDKKVNVIFYITKHILLLDMTLVISGFWMKKYLAKTYFKKID